jgi:hypothetical protein
MLGRARSTSSLVRFVRRTCPTDDDREEPDDRERIRVAGYRRQAASNATAIITGVPPSRLTSRRKRVDPLVAWSPPQRAALRVVAREARVVLRHDQERADRDRPASRIASATVRASRSARGIEPRSQAAGRAEGERAPRARSPSSRAAPPGRSSGGPRRSAGDGRAEPDPRRERRVQRSRPSPAPHAIGFTGTHVRTNLVHEETQNSRF